MELKTREHETRNGGKCVALCSVLVLFGFDKVTLR
ncbi:hypothetical protein A2U01_0065499, partial [Trifolium medium]|nr:hypothetical protein [Trifolium medium]